MVYLSFMKDLSKDKHYISNATWKRSATLMFIVNRYSEFAGMRVIGNDHILVESPIEGCFSSTVIILQILSPQNVESGSSATVTLVESSSISYEQADPGWY